MSKDITYWTRIFSPENEAISKEIAALQQSFGGRVVSVDSYRGFWSLFRFRWTKKLIRFSYMWFPLRWLLGFISKNSINHVFGTCNDRNLFLKKLKDNMIFTSVTHELPSNENSLKKISTLVVESEAQKKEAKEKGLQNVKLIYPGVEVHEVAPKPEGFSVVFASAPLSESYFSRRGIGLILEVASKNPDVEFVLFWRGNTTHIIKEKVKKLANVRVRDETVPTYEIYSAHVTVAPYTTQEENKSCPNSIIESLAFGTPVLVSSKVGISDVIEQEECGVVFEPDVENFHSALQKLKSNYSFYQLKSQPCARKYFDPQVFLKKYGQVYESMRKI